MPLALEPLIQRFVAGERVGHGGTHAVPMGVVVAVVRPEHPAVVTAEDQWVDIRQRFVLAVMIYGSMAAVNGCG